MAELHNMVATDGGASNGAAVWWQLSGEVDLAKLATVWAEEGLAPDALPEPPSHLVVLRRALRSLLKADDAGLVAPIDGEARGVGLQVLTKSKDARGRTQYMVEWEVRVSTATGTPTLEFARLDGADMNPDDQEWVAWEFSRGVGSLLASDVSVWLSRTVRAHDAVALRENGGVYFIPAPRMEPWRAVVRAIEASSAHKVWELPVLRSDKAVEALCAAFVAETTTEVERMSAALDNGDLGKRALQTRVTIATDIEGKMARLEAVLGTSMDDVRGTLTALRARLAEAVMAAEAGE